MLQTEICVVNVQVTIKSKFDNNKNNKNNFLIVVTFL